MRIFKFAAVMVATLGFLVCSPGKASYPKKPVRLLVGGTAGGSDDFHARLIAQKLSDYLGQPFIVDNRPGAGGLVAQTAVVNAMADGYTLLLAGRSLTAAPFLNANVTFDPRRSFAPVAQIATYQFVLVVQPSVKARTIGELVELARARPGKITYGAGQGGNMPYIAANIFRAMTKVDMYYIPYKSNAQIYADLLAGQIDVYFSGLVGALPHLKTGKLRPLGVTGATRSHVLKDVPTISEAGLPGYEAASWVFIAAPARTPDSVPKTVNDATARILASPDIRERLLAVGSEPANASPAELAKRIADATEQFAQIAKQLGIKPQ
jgi:tripartite-type tricarboxylate transporter receptor subunit TctC